VGCSCADWSSRPTLGSQYETRVRRLALRRSIRRLGSIAAPDNGNGGGANRNWYCNHRSGVGKTRLRPQDLQGASASAIKVYCDWANWSIRPGSQPMIPGPAKRQFANRPRFFGPGGASMGWAWQNGQRRYMAQSLLSTLANRGA